MKKGFDPEKIDEILSKTLDSIEEGRNDIFEIAETARREFENLGKELEEAKEKTLELIDEVDKLERQNKKAKQRLALVSKNFNKYDEETIKKAYDEASEVNAQLMIMRERESQMRKKRDELERRLKSLKETVERAENVANRMGVIENYLSEGLHNIGETLENLQQKQFLGLKVVRAQEEERRRVARDIHDGPAQGLANVVLRAEFCEKLLDQDVEKVRNELADLKQLVRGSLQDLRKIIFNLRPMTLDDLGLVPAIRRLVTEIIEEHGIEGEVVIFGEEKRLSRNLEVALFRIIQEALNNVKKHARAFNVYVKIQFGDDKIIINVRDNGQGFDTVRLVADKHNDDKYYDNLSAEEYAGDYEEEGNESIGLQNIKDRVENLGGEFNINSKQGEGTTLSIKVPLIS